MTKANIAKLDKIKEDLQSILDSEQESFDSKSEKWQESEKGEMAQSNIDYITESLEALENLEID